MQKWRQPDLLDVASCESPDATSAMTLSQSPGRGWRKRRIVGYQGESLRSSSHRKTGEKGSKTHVGLPIAPARCATAVSTAITRSRLSINAAESEKSKRRAAVSI